MSERELRIQHVPRFELECGAVLEDVRQAYYLDGTLNPERDNLVLVFHALTGDANAVGGWWREVLGAGRAIDTDHYAVLSPNLLGSRYGSPARVISRRESSTGPPRDRRDWAVSW